MGALGLALVIVALVLAGIAQIMARGTSLGMWAVIALAFAMLLPVLH